MTLNALPGGGSANKNLTKQEIEEIENQRAKAREVYIIRTHIRIHAAR